MLPTTRGISGFLTDGTGVSQLLASKILKDIILDLLLSLPAAFLAINVANLEQGLIASVAVVITVADAGIRVIYRAALRWAQS